MMKSLILFGLIMIFTSCASQATKSSESQNAIAPGKILAHIEENAIELGDSVELLLTWTQPADSESQGSKLPAMDDVEILSDEISKSDVKLGGDSYLTFNRRMVLKPKKLGTITVGPAEVLIGNDLIESEAIAISVEPEKYKEALQTNKCEKELLGRYELGNYFHSFATKMKIKPYDLVDGSSYSKKNLDTINQRLAQNHFLNYRDRFPKPFAKKFDQKFKNKKEEIRNKESVFNTLVKRDFECYQQLK